jgi:hypothetical protein|tara:strand:- start:58 stop:306 length:249 start_codon:yes stop_codon:yes gene_type:complete
MSWDDLKLVKNDAKIEVDDIDILMTKVFASRDGAQVLAYLKKITIDQPTWYPGEDASHGYAREGQNSIVRDIYKRIERTRNR